MPRTKPRPCPTGRHQLGPGAKTITGCLACEGEAATAHIVRIVTAIEPGLDRSVVEAAVASAAPSVLELRRLRAHLDTEQAALTSGSSWSPNVCTRLAHCLVAAGAQDVVLPRCADCGRPERQLYSKTADGRICNHCCGRRNAVACTKCGKVKAVGARDEGGAAWCSNCWTQGPRAEPCSLCGQPGRVNVRDANGGAVCGRCYRRPERRCGDCGELGRIVSTRTGTPLCTRCYEHPLRPCGRCGRLRQVGRRANVGEPELCVSCARPPLATCSQCGNRRRCHFVATGQPLCIPCSPRRTHQCAHCGRERKATAVWPEGPVCQSCYGAALRRRGTCADCQQERRLVDPPGREAVRCADCAGIVPVAGHICSRCGVEDKLYARDLCPRCVLSDRAQELLSGAGGSIPDPLLPLHEAIVASPSALQAIAWLRRSNAARMLSDIRAGGRLPTHEMLDDLGSPKAVSRLRQLLVSSGVLPARAEQLLGLERWIDHSVKQVDDADRRRLLRAYATWGLLARVRRASRGFDISVGAASRARARFKASVAFLEWLSQRGRTLATCGQADVEEWIAGGGQSRLDVRELVLWAGARRGAADLEVPARRWREGPALPTDERWAIAKRLLNDDGLPLVDRVSGSFVLLYAQRLGRVSRLTVDDVEVGHDGVSVRFGRDSVELVPPLGVLVTRLCAERRATAVGSPQTNWLFPGQLAGLPTSAEWLGQRLRRIGVSSPPARRAALMQLGAELPAVLLADLLGLAPGTAVHWVRAAGGDWARYAAERARLDSQ